MRKLFVFALCMLAAVSALAGGKARKGADDHKIEVVAHRGYWNCEKAGYAENSIAALRCAMEENFWGSEFDVNLTKDRELAVFHDPWAYGKSFIDNNWSAFAADTLKNGEKIPTLDEYLAAYVDFKAQMPGCTTKLVLELKPISRPVWSDAQYLEVLMLDKTMQVIQKHGLDENSVVFISFSHHICCNIAAKYPQYTNQYLQWTNPGPEKVMTMTSEQKAATIANYPADDCIVKYSPETVAKFGINGVDFSYQSFVLFEDWIAQARKAGMSVNCWTCDNAEHMKKMIELGVDQITTNYPTRARQLIETAEAAKNGHNVQIVAHRGFWNCEKAGYARNSIAALACAQEEGFWGSEFDVNITKDGQLVVFHDGHVNGKEFADYDFADFADVRLANGEKIPTLDEYLTQAEKNKKTVLVFELKTQKTTQLEDELVNKSIACLKAHGLFKPQQVIFISFSRHICDRIAAEYPKFTTQYLASNYEPNNLAQTGINGIDFFIGTFYKLPEWYRQARANKMSVNVWTVDHEADMQNMIDLGVDYITTDKPDVLRELLAK